MNNTTILIVEDDKTIQNFLKVTLKTQNYNYIIAETGLSGLSLFYANRPDLVLLDLGLPDIEAKNEHGQQTTGIRYRRALWLFRKGLSSGTRKDFNVEDDFLTSDDPADIR